MVDVYAMQLEGVEFVDAKLKIDRAVRGFLEGLREEY
jgi:hypothetical protein